ncbi:MAG: PD-(D/E)XK motif protein [Vallitaleaceae bacterium]|nr:PD-(D/E)XK motif protein [Vallitaleaceae bacterium]
MNNYDSKTRFTVFSAPSHYLRVDKDHPLELLVGLNDNGQKTIRLVQDFKPVNIKSTRSIDVNHYPFKDKKIISFSLTDPEFRDLFYLFCNDLVDSSRNINPKDGYEFIVNRFNKWKGFSNTIRKHLSESQIKGLIGELIFLSTLMTDKYGIDKSISGWSGPEPTKKDFSYDDVWYEVKSATKDTVSISSIDQLKSDIPGFLVVYQLEKMSPEAQALSLNSLVDEILNIISIDENRLKFIMKLVQAGYHKEDYYDSYKYRLSRQYIYQVNNNFPGINESTLHPALCNVKFDLILNMLETFRKDNI